MFGDNSFQLKQIKKKKQIIKNKTNKQQKTPNTLETLLYPHFPIFLFPSVMNIIIFVFRKKTGTEKERKTNEEVGNSETSYFLFFQENSLPSLKGKVRRFYFDKNTFGKTNLI